MPSELKKPEPVAWIWKYANGEEEVVFVDLSKHQLDPAEVDVPSEVTPLHTAAQLEQYAADRVREALERAAQECDRLTHALDNAGTSYHRPATADRCARAIRTLKEQTK